MSYVDILDPIQFATLIVGAMIPYAFAACTMSSVGETAEKLVKKFEINSVL